MNIKKFLLLFISFLFIWYTANLFAINWPTSTPAWETPWWVFMKYFSNIKWRCAEGSLVYWFDNDLKKMCIAWDENVIDWSCGPTLFSCWAWSSIDWDSKIDTPDCWENKSWTCLWTWPWADPKVCYQANEACAEVELSCWADKNTCIGWDLYANWSCSTESWHSGQYWWVCNKNPSGGGSERIDCYKNDDSCSSWVNPDPDPVINWQCKNDTLWWCEKWIHEKTFTTPSNCGTDFYKWKCKWKNGWTDSGECKQKLVCSTGKCADTINNKYWFTLPTLKCSVWNVISTPTFTSNKWTWKCGWAWFATSSQCSFFKCQPLKKDWIKEDILLNDTSPWAELYRDNIFRVWDAAWIAYRNGRINESSVANATTEIKNTAKDFCKNVIWNNDIKSCMKDYMCWIWYLKNANYIYDDVNKEFSKNIDYNFASSTSYDYLKHKCEYPAVHKDIHYEVELNCNEDNYTTESQKAVYGIYTKSLGRCPDSGWLSYWVTEYNKLEGSSSNKYEKLRRKIVISYKGYCNNFYDSDFEEQTEDAVTVYDFSFPLGAKQKYLDCNNKIFCWPWELKYYLVYKNDNTKVVRSGHTTIDSSAPNHVLKGYCKIPSTCADSNGNLKSDSVIDQLFPKTQ